MEVFGINIFEGSDDILVAALMKLEGMAGFLHDIGKQFISPGILEKSTQILGSMMMLSKLLRRYQVQIFSLQM